VKSALLRTTAAVALGASLLTPFAANAKSSDHRTFDGNVVHISSSNIKVQGTEGGKSQTLSFVINHGTTMMKVIKPGEYVRVTFDQKLLGLRHADAIDPYASPAMKMKT
jgi:hypothetical protein